jgi:signal transduction histidine kinase
MGALILLISAAIWVYLPQKLEQEAIALVTHKAETLAQLTAFTIHPSIYFRDRPALAEALRGTTSDKDVAYVVVMGADGKALASFHPERVTGAALARTVPGGSLSPDGRLYEEMTPVRDDSAELARLYIGVSLARVQGRIARIRFTIGLMSLIIMALGITAVTLISGVLTRPLRDVAFAVRRIAAGEADQRVAHDRLDEIGDLAAAFNDMAAKVSARNAALRQSHDQLRLLSRRLLEVQEQERVRIAREVHDELGQALTAIKIDLQQLSSREHSLQDSVAPIAAKIDGTVDLVRRIAADLRPSVLDDLGISAALEQQLRRLKESTGMITALDIAEEPELDMLTGTALYRIAQEALANVVRHSRASEVRVSLAVENGKAVMTIRDNGIGISPARIAAADSLGLLGMRERAELLGGEVVIEGQPGQGTMLTVTLPLTRES